MKSKKLTRYAVISAIVFAGFALDTIFQNVFPFTPAVVSLIAVMTICLASSLKESVFAGFIFGVFSLLRAVVIPSIAGTLLLANFWTSFMNPLVSVLPRICIGLVAWSVNSLLKKPIKSTYGSGVLASIAGVLTNTLTVCIVLFIMNTLTTPNFDMLGFVYGFFTINFIFEVVITALVAPLIAIGVKRSGYFGGN